VSSRVQNVTFLKIQDGGGCHLGKFTKVRIWANSRPIYSKFGVLIDMVNVSVICVKNSTFRKFKTAEAAILKIHERVYLSQGRYKYHQGSKISLFRKSRWRRPPFWKIHKRAYIGQFVINMHQILYASRYRQCRGPK